MLACHAPERQKQDMDSAESYHSGSNDENIIIYGSRNCPHCVVFIRKLNEKGISYIFKEVDNDDTNFKEMYDKIQSVNFKGYVNYPVLDVGGEILVNPEFDRFYEIYRHPQSDG
jgi:glutaredoxin